MKAYQANSKWHFLVTVPVSVSVVTAAVRPTPVDPRPVVGMALGAVKRTYRSSWDLATDGSPGHQTNHGENQHIEEANTEITDLSEGHLSTTDQSAVC